MTISEAIQQFEKIKIANSSQGVQKACQKFIVTLKSLEERDLNIEEQELLRLELDQLDFTRFSKASAIRKSYRHFLSILHKKLSLTRKISFALQASAIEDFCLQENAVSNLSSHVPHLFRASRHKNWIFPLPIIP